MAAVTTLASNAIGFGGAPQTGQSHEMHQGHEASGQTFAKGAVLILSGGRLAEASNSANTNIVGIALQKASGTQDTLISYLPTTSSQVFEATLENQATAGYTLAQTDLYVKYGIYKDTNGIWYINQNDTTNKAVVIVGVKNDSDIGSTVRSRVFCRFLIAATPFQS